MQVPTIGVLFQNNPIWSGENHSLNHADCSGLLFLFKLNFVFLFLFDNRSQLVWCDAEEANGLLKNGVTCSYLGLNHLENAFDGFDDFSL